MIEKRQLARTGHFVSRVGFGCSAYWANASFPEDKAFELVEIAVAGGINFFDTGSSYAHGDAERRLGKVLSSLDSTDLIIATKAGTTFDERGKQTQDFTPDWLRRSVDESLERLGLGKIHLLQLHGPLDPDDLNDAVIETLLDLKAQGLIDAFGLSSFDPVVLHKSSAYEDIDTTMLDYNILRRDREEMIAAFSKSRSVIAATPIARAVVGNRLLRLRSKADLWYLARALFKLRGDVRDGFSYRFLNEFDQWSLSQISLGYVLANDNITSAIFGTVSKEHLEANLRIASVGLEAEIVERIRKV